MNTEISTKKSRGLSGWFEMPSVQERIGSALGGWMDQKMFCAQLQISLEDENFKDCSDVSKFEAAHLCAALAMLPSLQQL